MPRGRARSLLACLALSPGCPVSLDSLVTCLWGDDGAPLSTRQSLQNLVWRLRGVLGSDAVVADGDTYALRIASDAVDVSRFTGLLHSAAAAEQPEEIRELLTEALDLWRGEPFLGIESESLRRDWTPALTEQHLAAVERRCDIDLDAGRSAELVAQLWEWTSRHPLRESLWVRLLTALSGAGREAEALAAYEQVRSLLAERLGADPSAELRELHRRLLAHEGPTPTTVPSFTAATTVEPGPAVPESGQVPRQLPPQPPGFVGRDEQLAELTRLVERGAADAPVGTVVVHGTAGVGKTALAVRWAHRAADRFPHGQFFLNLRGYGPGEPMPVTEALSAMLRSVGVDAGGSRSTSTSSPRCGVPPWRVDGCCWSSTTPATPSRCDPCCPAPMPWSW